MMRQNYKKILVICSSFVKKNVRHVSVCFHVELRAVIECDNMNPVQMYNSLKISEMKLGLLEDFGYPVTGASAR